MAYGQSPYRLAVARECLYTFFRLYLPNVKYLIFPGADKAIARWRKGNGINLFCVPFKGMQASACFHLPQFYQMVTATTG